MFDVSGTIDLSATPTVINMGDRFKVSYRIAFDFLFGNGTNIFGTGFMVVDGNGCGLFDCNMAAFAQNGLGNNFLWEVGDGAFFHDDGTPYPSVFASALPYVVPPSRFELYGSDILHMSGPAATAARYAFTSPIVATRVEGVPEPSTLLLTGLGALALFKKARARRPAVARQS